ncbi:MAG: hypothetical protein MZU91_12210 [Desulfosudis oleivorans]|nr:hypothetical protein [Desulfosudis oleivorans]
MQPRSATPSATLRAYGAGLADGEGCIQIIKQAVAGRAEPDLPPALRDDAKRLCDARALRALRGRGRKDPPREARQQPEPPGLAPGPTTARRRFAVIAVLHRHLVRKKARGARADRFRRQGSHRRCAPRPAGTPDRLWKVREARLSRKLREAEVDPGAEMKTNTKTLVAPRPVAARTVDRARRPRTSMQQIDHVRRLVAALPAARNLRPHPVGACTRRTELQQAARLGKPLERRRAAAWCAGGSSVRRNWATCALVAQAPAPDTLDDLAASDSQLPGRDRLRAAAPRAVPACTGARAAAAADAADGSARRGAGTAGANALARLLGVPVVAVAVVDADGRARAGGSGCQLRVGQARLGMGRAGHAAHVADRPAGRGRQAPAWP